MTAAALAGTHGTKCRMRLHSRRTTDAGRQAGRTTGAPVNALLPRGNGSLRRSPHRPSRSHRPGGLAGRARTPHEPCCHVRRSLIGNPIHRLRHTVVR